LSSLIRKLYERVDDERSMLALLGFREDTGEMTNMQAGRQAKRGVGRPRRLTLDAIVAAACDIGLEKLEMQQVAERLGTGVATLYGYVRDRDHLEHLVVQRLAADGQLADHGQSWQDLLREHAALAFRTTEAMPHLIVDLIEMEPNEQENAYAAKMLAKLTARGLGCDEALSLYIEVSQAVIGAAILNARVKRLNIVDPNRYPLARSSVLGDYRPTVERIIGDQERSGFAAES
jgi:AcrR family transcriptional regulator